MRKFHCSEIFHTPCITGNVVVWIYGPCNWTAARLPGNGRRAAGFSRPSTSCAYYRSQETPAVGLDASSAKPREVERSRRPPKSMEDQFDVLEVEDAVCILRAQKNADPFCVGRNCLIDVEGLPGGAVAEGLARWRCQRMPTARDSSIPLGRQTVDADAGMEI
jgi:hypothetical protein